MAQKNAHRNSKNQKLIVGGVILAGLGIMGLVSWIKSHPWKSFEKTIENVEKTGNVLTSMFPTKEGTQSYKSYQHKSGLKITSPYGYRQSTGTFHAGIDIGHARGGSVLEGDPVPSLTDGTAQAYVNLPGGDQPYNGSEEQLKKASGFGLYVLVECTPEWKERIGYPNAKTVHIRYGHLSKVNFSGKKEVKRGDTIGFVGHTGSVGRTSKKVPTHLDLTILVDGIPVKPGEGSYLPWKSGVATVDPTTVKWLDSLGKETDIISAYGSMAYPKAEKTEQAISTITQWGNAIDRKLGIGGNISSTTPPQSSDSSLVFPSSSSSVSTFGKTDGLFDSGNTIISAVANNTSGSGFNQPTTQTIMYQPQNQQQGSSISSNYGFTAGSNLQNMASGNNKNSIGVFK